MKMALSGVRSFIRINDLQPSNIFSTPNDFQQHIPSHPLSCYVESILYLEGNNKGTGLPKTAMSLVFNLGDPFRLYNETSFVNATHYEKYWLAGFQRKPRYVESDGHSQMIVIQFKTIGAFAFLEEPLHYFTDDYIPLDQIDQQKAENTWQQLQEAGSLKEKYLVTENFLYQCLLAHRLPDIRLIRTVDLLLQNNSNSTIAAICQELRVSRKHLNHLFKESLGISPKTLAVLYRFQKSLQSLSTAKPERLSSFAYEMDYFDQAHFNNEFKKLSGLRPSEYINQTEQFPSLQIVPHFLPKID